MDYHGTETDIHPIRKRITSQDKNHIELNLKTYKRLYRKYVYRTCYDSILNKVRH